MQTNIPMDRPVAQAAVVIEAVGKAFGGVGVLHDVNLTVRQGEAVVILGASGSGKTTLLRCVNRLEEVTSGRILIGGEEITAKGADLNAIRRNVGMVFQQIHLYPHMTALQNVTLALRKVARIPAAEADTIAMRHLTLMELADKASMRPHQLSGGQQQRVGIARAMAMDPSVILFDEPTSALDPELVGEVLKAMEKTRSAGKTMIVVTHEVQFAREIADRIVFMADGRVLADGTPEEVFARGRHPRIDSFLQRVVG